MLSCLFWWRWSVYISNSVLFSCSSIVTCRMLNPRSSKEVVDGGSVHVWLDLTSEYLSPSGSFEMVFSLVRLHVSPLGGSVGLVQTVDWRPGIHKSHSILLFFFSDRQIALMLQKKLHDAFEVSGRCSVCKKKKKIFLIETSKSPLQIAL